MGSIFGFIFALAAGVLKIKRLAKGGIFVETVYLQRNEPLQNLLKEVRPLCQTGRISVHSKYKEFIKEVDCLVGAVLNNRDKENANHQRFIAPQYLSNVLSLLRQGLVKPDAEHSDVLPVVDREIRRLLNLIPR